MNPSGTISRLNETVSSWNASVDAAGSPETMVPSVQHGGRCRQAVGQHDDDGPVAEAARHRMHDHRREQSERGEGHRRHAGGVGDDAEARQRVRREFAQVPGQAQERGGQRQPVHPARVLRGARPAPQHQRQQHGVQRRAGGEAHQVDDVGRVGGGHPSILVIGWPGCAIRRANGCMPPTNGPDQAMSRRHRTAIIRPLPGVDP